MRGLVRSIVSGALLLVGSRSCGQSDTLAFPTPYDPHGARNTWALKGKAFPFPLGDHLGLTALLGVELGFFKRHSVGVDGFIAHISGTYDAFTDTAGIEHPDGGSTFTTYKAVFVNYRYYLGTPALREKGWIPYVGAFYRYGTVNGEGDAEYTRTDLEFHETHRSGGPLLGTIYEFDVGGRFALDMNVGLFRKHVEEVRYDLVDGSLVATNGDRVFNSVRVGLNLYYWFLW